MGIRQRDSDSKLRIRRFDDPYRGISSRLEDFVRCHLHISRGDLRFPEFWLKEELFATAYGYDSGVAALLDERVEIHLPFHRGVRCGITFERRVARIAPV